MVIQSPDNSLWFLLALFIFLMIWHTWKFIAGTLALVFKDSHLRLVNAMPVRAMVAALSLLAVQNCMPLFGGKYGFVFVDVYYIYSCAGILFHLLRAGRLDETTRLIAYVTFAALAPFWHRAHMSDVAHWLEVFMRPEDGDWMFRFVVALCGSLVIVDIANAVARSGIAFVGRALAYCGTASLGIYAVHSHLLSYRPAVLAPLLGSLALYWGVTQVPILRTLFFGERQASAPLNIRRWFNGMFRRRGAEGKISSSA